MLMMDPEADKNGQDFVGSQIKDMRQVVLLPLDLASNLGSEQLSSSTHRAPLRA